jgi:uncharacterized membrane protein
MIMKAKTQDEITEQESILESISVVSEQVLKNVETIAVHQDPHQKAAGVDRRVLNRITAFVRQPQFLYCQIGFFAIWGLGSYLVEQGILTVSFPLFNLREEGLGVASLLTSTGVLIYQSRQEALSEERSHLTLQINLLAEQKITKLIALVEELRTDLSNVKNRDDLEAEIMQQPTDVQAILDVLQKN